MTDFSVMSDMHYCVIWNRESNRLEMAPLDVLLQLNNASFIEDRPARALLRTGLSEDGAKRFIRGFAGVMAKRSLARLESEPKAQAAEVTR